MTSNIGSHLITEISDKQERDTKIREELKKYFRIEFLNRIDDTIIFDPLGVEDLKTITKHLLDEVSLKLRDQGIDVIWDQSVIDRVSTLGYDSALGARPLRRALVEYVVNPLSEKMLLGAVKE